MADVGRRLQQRGQQRRAFTQMLEVIEQQQEPLPAQVGHEDLHGIFISQQFDVQRPGDCRRELFGVVERRQRHEDGGAVEMGRCLPGSFDGQARLANAAWADEAYQTRAARIAEDGRQLGQLAAAAHERGGLDR
jgi:hypothetical protein